MEVKSIDLVNFRGIRSLHLDFNEQMNVLVGINGNGKTSILDSIAKMLSWVSSRTANEKSSGERINDLDIRERSHGTHISISCQHQDQLFSWTQARPRAGRLYDEAKTDFADLNKLTHTLQRSLTDAPDTAPLPLSVYYPVNRAVLEIPIRLRGRREFNQLSAYENALTSAANFRTFFEWFRLAQESMYANFMDDVIDRIKGGMSVTEALDQDPRELGVIKQAIYTFMPNFKGLRIRHSPLRMVVTKGDCEVQINQLSGGEKIILALIGDLARRLSIANPNSDNPLHGEGIVLIDELDLHLHPQWQRTVIDNLPKVFPNCQFIISTHSPHILTHVAPETITTLKSVEGNIIADSVRTSYGHEANLLLESIMGLETTRPDSVKKAIEEIYSSISANEFLRASKLLQQLKTVLTDDPEITRLELLLSRKKAIGK